MTAPGAEVFLRGRSRRTPPAGLAAAAALAAAAFGAALASHPLEAVLVLCLTPLALGAPVASLGVVLFVTVLVPFDLQNKVSLGGGAGLPGLLVVDILIGLGLCRIVALLIRDRLRASWPILIAGGLLVALVAAMAYGLAEGADASAVGTEARPMVVGAGAFVLAWPLLRDPVDRRRLYRILFVLGIALGLWGIAQVVFGVEYSTAGDVGVRPGIDQISSVRGGQLQGGLFAFPVAVVLSFAYLLTGEVRSAGSRGVAAWVFALNSVCVLLTYERTIWGAAAIGCLVAAVWAGRRSWPAAARWLAVGAVGILVFTLLTPGSFGTVSDRITSVYGFQTDNSVQARQVESAAVIRAIRRHPLEGLGYGATITWGKEDVFATTTTGFTHDGYLWLAWKIGIPLALAVVGTLAWVALRRRRPTRDPDLAALRLGSQAALVAVLLICVTFPVFDTLGITAVLGLLLAVCLAPARA